MLCCGRGQAFPNAKKKNAQAMITFLKDKQKFQIQVINLNWFSKLV